MASKGNSVVFGLGSPSPVSRVETIYNDDDIVRDEDIQKKKTFSFDGPGNMNPLAAAMAAQQKKSKKKKTKKKSKKQEIKKSNPQSHSSKVNSLSPKSIGNTTARNPKIKYYIAAFDFSADMNFEGQLSIKKNDVLILLEEFDDGWSHVEYVTSREAGVVPTSYLTLKTDVLTTSAADTTTASTVVVATTSTTSPTTSSTKQEAVLDEERRTNEVATPISDIQKKKSVTATENVLESSFSINNEEAIKKDDRKKVKQIRRKSSTFFGEKLHMKMTNNQATRESETDRNTLEMLKKKEKDIRLRKRQLWFMERRMMLQGMYKNNSTKGEEEEEEEISWGMKIQQDPSMTTPTNDTWRKVPDMLKEVIPDKTNNDSSEEIPYNALSPKGGGKMFRRSRDVKVTEEVVASNGRSALELKFHSMANLHAKLNAHKVKLFALRDTVKEKVDKENKRLDEEYNLFTSSKSELNRVHEALEQAQVDTEKWYIARMKELASMAQELQKRNAKAKEESNLLAEASQPNKNYKPQKRAQYLSALIQGKDKEIEKLKQRIGIKI